MECAHRGYYGSIVREVEFAEGNCGILQDMSVSPCYVYGFDTTRDSWWYEVHKDTHLERKCNRQFVAKISGAINECWVLLSSEFVSRDQSTEVPNSALENAENSE